MQCAVAHAATIYAAAFRGRRIACIACRASMCIRIHRSNEVPGLPGGWGPLGSKPTLFGSIVLRQRGGVVRPALPTQRSAFLRAACRCAAVWWLHCLGDVGCLAVRRGAGLGLRETWSRSRCGAALGLATRPVCALYPCPRAAPLSVHSPSLASGGHTVNGSSVARSWLQSIMDVCSHSRTCLLPGALVSALCGG